MHRKAHIDGKTKEKQGNDYHKVRLVGTSLGTEGITVRKRDAQPLEWWQWSRPFS